VTVPGNFPVSDVLTEPFSETERPLLIFFHFLPVKVFPCVRKLRTPPCSLSLLLTCLHQDSYEPPFRLLLFFSTYLPLPSLICSLLRRSPPSFFRDKKGGPIGPPIDMKEIIPLSSISPFPLPMETVLLLLFPGPSIVSRLFLPFPHTLKLAFLQERLSSFFIIRKSEHRLLFPSFLLRRPMQEKMSCFYLFSPGSDFLPNFFDLFRKLTRPPFSPQET